MGKEKRRLHRLTAIAVQKIAEPGRYPDGGNLWLQVSRWRTKSWIFIYTRDDKTRHLGLGPIADVTLAEAREKALEMRKVLHAGLDPFTERKARKLRQALEIAKSKTFDEVAAEYIATNESAWRNEKHRYQWRQSIASYASPVIGKLSVQDVDSILIQRVLEPIWYSKTETAVRLRGRLEIIFNFATAKGYRIGENPARWKGNLDNILRRPASFQEVTHLSALPIDEIPGFMKGLSMRPATAARMMEFVILTAARTGEALLAKWCEIDWQGRCWTIPASRMKAKKEHRVPLTSRCIAILTERKLLSKSEFIFTGEDGAPLSNMAMLVLLKHRMGLKHLTVHGFRSTFRDFAADRTTFPREVAEGCLAHILQGVEAAYRRSDLFEKRRQLLEAWERYCVDGALTQADVIEFRTGALA